MKFRVENLRCGFCAVAITRAIESVRGRARVGIRGGVVQVTDNLDAELVERIIRATGYSVVDIQQVRMATLSRTPVAESACRGNAAVSARI